MIHGEERYVQQKISLAGEAQITAGGIYTTVDAQEALKCIGSAYGLYDHAEEFRDQRVLVDKSGGNPALVVQEDVSHHGSPLWETLRTITDDPQQIQRYMAFRDTLQMMRQMDREAELHPAQGDPQQPQKKGRQPYER